MVKTTALHFEKYLKQMIRMNPATILRAIVIAITFALTAPAATVEIMVDATKFTIPVPEGFSEVTSDMNPYADIMSHFVSPENKRLAFFIPDEFIDAVKDGATPDVMRRINVEIIRDMSGKIVTKSDFQEFKKILENENGKILEAIESKLPDMMKKINGDLFEDYNADVSFDVSGISMLPIHHDTERSIAYSIIANAIIDDGSENNEFERIVATCTFVHLKGKLLCLYVYAEKEGIEWSRATSKNWVDLIIAQNPSTDEELRLENQSRFRFDFVKPLKSAIIGAIAGGITAFVYGLWKRRKKTVQTPPDTTHLK